MQLSVVQSLQKYLLLELLFVSSRPMVDLHTEMQLSEQASAAVNVLDNKEAVYLSEKAGHMHMTYQPLSCNKETGCGVISHGNGKISAEMPEVSRTQTASCTRSYTWYIQLIPCTVK